MARRCGGGEAEVAGAVLGQSEVRAAAMPLTSTSARAAEVGSAVPKVSIDELPREHYKKGGEPRAPAAGAAMPAKKDDPFARRH